MFWMAAKRVAQSNPPNWKRFWNRIRSHESKIAQAEVRLQYILSLAAEELDDDLAMPGMSILFDRGLLPRNASLYVEPGPDGAFRKPSDIDWSIGVTALK